MHLAQTSRSPRPVLREAAKQNGSSAAAPDADGPSAGDSRCRSGSPHRLPNNRPALPRRAQHPGPGRGRRSDSAGPGKAATPGTAGGRGRRRGAGARPARVGGTPLARTKELGQAAPATPPIAAASSAPATAPAPPQPPSRGEGSRAGALPGRRAPHQSPGRGLAPLGADWLSAAEVGGPGGRRRGGHIYRAALFKPWLCGCGGWRVRGPAGSACGPLR